MNAAPGWIHSSRAKPCPNCGETGAWCRESSDGSVSICQKAGGPDWEEAQDKNGQVYWRRFNGGNGIGGRGGIYIPSLAPLVYAPGPSTNTTPLDPDTLHAVYSDLLNEMPLSVRHMEALVARGLTESQVHGNGYGTRPDSRFHRERIDVAVSRLLVRYGSQTLLRVPGFYVKYDRLTVGGSEGIMIPVRDVRGRIQGIRIRRNSPGNGGKYNWLSSAGEGGPSPGSPCHVPLHDGDTVRVMAITEGELKADVATALKGTLVVSAPGVGLWSKTLPVIEALNPEWVIIAFDQDDPIEHPKAVEVVRRAKQDATNFFSALGYGVTHLSWDGGCKGLDDAILNGGGLHATRMAHPRVKVPLDSPVATEPDVVDLEDTSEAPPPWPPASGSEWEIEPYATETLKPSERCREYKALFVRSTGAALVIGCDCKSWSCGKCARKKAMEWLRHLIAPFLDHDYLYIGEVLNEDMCRQRIKKAMLRLRKEGHRVEFLRAERSFVEGDFMGSRLHYVATVDLGGSLPWRRVSPIEAHWHVRTNILRLPGVSGRVMVSKAWLLPKKEDEPSPGFIERGRGSDLQGAINEAAAIIKRKHNVIAGVGIDIDDPDIRKDYVTTLKAIARDPARGSRPDEEIEEEDL